MVQNRVVVSFTVVWSVATVLALTLGIRLNWPDYDHVNYGFPMVWGTHVLSTIQGPVDIWKVDVFALLVDLVFWSGSLVTGLLFLQLPKDYGSRPA